MEILRIRDLVFRLSIALYLVGHLNPLSLLDPPNLPLHMSPLRSRLLVHLCVALAVNRGADSRLLDGECPRDYIVQDEIVESAIRVVNEHQQHLVPACASCREDFLASADVAAAVHHSQLRRPHNRSSCYRSKLLRAKISPNWCCQKAITRRGIRGVQRIPQNHRLTGL